MKKKWECSECDYNNGRRWNVARHIRTMHYAGSPHLSARYSSKSASKYDVNNAYLKSDETSSDLVQKNQNEHDAKVFADSYQFKEPIIGILMQFNKALTLKEGFEKDMIMKDLFKQFKRETATPRVVFPSIYLEFSNTLKTDQNSRVSQWPFTPLSGNGLHNSTIERNSNWNSDSRKPIGENGLQKKLGYVIRKFSKAYQDRQKRGLSHEKFE
jgi:hypothetical protein